ncbi:MAG: molecular chaperone HtpG, partial [Gammaproteobacteria bacterium]
IAKSGTRQFFSALTGDAARDSKLIGQFGVGFYSSFMVAEKVEVVTRRAGLARGEGVRWISAGRSDYTIETLDRPKRGTRVTLFLREGASEFLDGARLRGIIRKYSDHISLPIVMDAAGKGEETVNSATALWTRNKKDIQDLEYREFYKHVGHDFEDPLAWVHSKVEGKLEYTCLLFIPSRAPFNLWDRDRRHGVKLYVKRVFIMDDAEQLLPPYLRFVRGVVDSDDLPLNISREILQQNRTIDAIRSGCTKKVLDLLEGMAADDRDKYSIIWKEFGRVLKEGVIDAPDKQADLAKLFRFASIARDDDEQSVSLPDYVNRMADGQEAIYYITAESPRAARGSPHLEIFREKGIEVLILTDPIDEWLTLHMTEFGGKPLRSVARGDLDLGALKPADGQRDESKERDNSLLQRMKDALGERVQEIRVTQRLTTSPACLVAGEHDMTRHMQKILQVAGQEFSAAKPILEINPRHPIIRRLGAERDAQRFADWSQVLFDQAVLSEGGQLQDAAGFVRKLNNLLQELAGGTDPGE